MLMTPITPKVMARPMAASSSTEPSAQAVDRRSGAHPTAQRLRSSAARAPAAARATRSSPLRHRSQSESASWPPRALTVVDGRELLIVGAVGDVSDQRGSGLLHERRLTRGVGLLRRALRCNGSDRRRIAAAEDVFGRLEARTAGSAANKCQAADGSP